MEVIDKLGWIYIKSKKILCARSKGKNVFYIPGGKRKQGEEDKETLTREIKEELGIDLISENLKLVNKFEGPAHGKSEDVVLKMSCYSGDFKGEISPNSEIEEVTWLAYTDKEKTTPMGRIILSWFKNRNLID